MGCVQSDFEESCFVPQGRAGASLGKRSRKHRRSGDTVNVQAKTIGTDDQAVGQPFAAAQQCDPADRLFLGSLLAPLAARKLRGFPHPKEKTYLQEAEFVVGCADPLFLIAMANSADSSRRHSRRPSSEEVEDDAGAMQKPAAADAPSDTDASAVSSSDASALSLSSPLLLPVLAEAEGLEDEERKLDGVDGAAASESAPPASPTGSDPDKFHEEEVPQRSDCCLRAGRDGAAQDLPIAQGEVSMSQALLMTGATYEQ